MDLSFINGHHNIAISLADGVFPCAVVEADFHSWNGMFWVARCFVQPKHRRHGFGTQIMTKLCQELDDRHAAAYLIPNPYDETISLRRLIAFYERFGFKRGRVPEGRCWIRQSKSSTHASRNIAAASTDAL